MTFYSEKSSQDDAHVRKDTDCDIKLVYGRKIKVWGRILVLTCIALS